MQNTMNDNIQEYLKLKVRFLNLIITLINDQRLSLNDREKVKAKGKEMEARLKELAEEAGFNRIKAMDTYLEI